MAEHVDETGQPCTRHAAASPHGMLALALLGSRMPGFHHDIASKLQSMMMALEEVGELAETPELQAAVAIANQAVRDMQTLFAANRALQRPPQRKSTPLAELVASAAQRSGVKTRGDLSAFHVDVSLSTVTHALAITFDLAAGPTKLGRTLDLAAAIDGEHVVLTATGPATALDTLPPNAGDVLALASFALVREQGELCCRATGFTIRLPLMQQEPLALR